MARHAQDREDLLRDAKALVERIELHLSSAGTTEIVFAGFRANGALSLYFDQDPAYHFNSLGQIRRAFWEDQLVKAEQGRLVALKTTRSDSTVEMLRHEMTDGEQQRFSEQLNQRLIQLADQLRQKDFQIKGQVPAEADLLVRLTAWLEQFLGNDLAIAENPRVA